MTIFWFITTILIVLLILIILSKLTATIHYYHSDDNDRLIITIKALYGLITKKIDVPVIKVEDASVKFRVNEQKEVESSTKKKMTVNDVIESIKDTRKFIRSVQDAQPIIRRFFRKMVIYEFSWQSAVGTRDASLTAKLTGFIWSCKGIVQMLLFKNVDMRCQPYFEVIPSFNQKRSVTDLRCIVSISIGNTIITAVKLIVHYKRNGGHFRTHSVTKKESV